MLEALLQRLLDEDPEASLRREGGGFVLNVREPGEVWAEAFRPYKAELLALTRPLLGHKEVWRSLVAAFRDPPEGPYEVHVDPVFGVPMALRVSRGHPVEAARRLLAEAPVYGLAVVKGDRGGPQAPHLVLARGPGPGEAGAPTAQGARRPGPPGAEGRGPDQGGREAP